MKLRDLKLRSVAALLAGILCAGFAAAQAASTAPGSEPATPPAPAPAAPPPPPDPPPAPPPPDVPRVTAVEGTLTRSQRGLSDTRQIFWVCTYNVAGARRNVQLNESCPQTLPFEVRR
jgi:hypothetical protein